MADHHRRVKNAVRIAKEFYGKKLLQDIYPTHYLPNVGRQVMRDGGPPEDVSDQEAQYDAMGNVVVPSSKKAPEEGRYRQPFGERVSEGISKGFGEHRLGMSEENQRRYDPTGILQTFAAPADAFLRAPGALVGGLSAAGAGLYGMIPGTSESDVNRLQRDLRVLGDVGMIEAGQVRPKAPTYTDSIPRGGDVLPPEPTFRPAIERSKPPTIDVEAPQTALNPAPKPLELTREVQERQVTTPEPAAAAAEAPRDLEQIRVDAKQRFDEAVQALRADPQNAELKANLAERQKEMVQAKKDAERAARAERPQQPQAPAVPEMPPYERKVSEMGLYSHAAEVAANARKSGSPKDIIEWLKAQPGVKFEELRDAGAIKSNGEYNPEFAPGISSMTTRELADRLNSAIPEVISFVDPEVVQTKVDTLADFRRAVLYDPELWNKYLRQKLGSYFNYEGLMDDVTKDPYIKNIIDTELQRAFEETGGVIDKPGTAKYGPSAYPDLTTFGDGNYREIPLAIAPYEENPPTHYALSGMFGDSQKYSTVQEAEAALERKRQSAREVLADDPVQLDRILKNIDRTYVTEEVDPNFVSKNLANYGHMSHVMNNVAWLRAQDVIMPDRTKALRIEETQSDISQRGRKGGFRLDEEELQPLKNRLADLKKRYDEGTAKINADYNKYYEEVLKPRKEPLGGSFDRFLTETGRREEFRDLSDLSYAMKDVESKIKNNDKALPRLPYVSDTQHWTDLTTKKALLEAVKGGYDSLQFITGDVNRARYPTYEDGDPGHHYDVNVPSSLRRVLKSIDPDAKVELIHLEPNRNDPRYNARKEDLEWRIKTNEKEMENLRKKIDEDPNKDNEWASDYSYEVEYLQEETKIFENQLYALTHSHKYWSVKITPKIRAAVEKGLPRYKRGGAIVYKAKGGPVRDFTVEEFQRALEG